MADLSNLTALTSEILKLKKKKLAKGPKIRQIRHLFVASLSCKIRYSIHRCILKREDLRLQVGFQWKTFPSWALSEALGVHTADKQLTSFWLSVFFSRRQERRIVKEKQETTDLFEILSFYRGRTGNPPFLVSIYEYNLAPNPLPPSPPVIFCGRQSK